MCARVCVCINLCFCVTLRASMCVCLCGVCLVLARVWRISVMSEIELYICTYVVHIYNNIIMCT